MLSPYRSIVAPFSLLFIISGLLTNCSSPGSTTPPADAAAGAAAVPPPVAARTPGTRADSLGGIPGHQFGAPLSAFPGLKLLPATQQQPGYTTYRYPDGKGEPGWFGKRERERPGAYYCLYRFRDGRFVSFAAKAFGQGPTPLQEQARYLFGPGTRRQDGLGTNWDGKQVFASIESDYTPGLNGEWLHVDSQDLLRTLAKEKADKLKAENAL